MHLIDIRKSDLSKGKLVLLEVTPDNAPPYAILSHRWGTEEVLFVHIQQQKDIQHNAGLPKVAEAIKQATADGYNYVWIDNVCINKSSSAEVSEAINSMFDWYGNAAVCYAYLHDVHAPTRSETDHLFDAIFARSVWFTRGFTLQELLAPADVRFFDVSWTYFGDKTTLQPQLTKITRIEKAFLWGEEPLSSASVAKRMSWAALRTTTRIEDVAYCLMGLFSVNMPLLYGEGTRAFIRLQEEIMRTTDDHTLFAWKHELGRLIDPARRYGLLASSPRPFLESGEFVYLRDSDDREPHMMTNKGISIRLAIAKELYWSEVDNEVEMVSLLCQLPQQPGKYASIMVCPISVNSRQYARVDASYLQLRDDIPQSNFRHMYFPHTPSAPANHLPRSHQYRVELSEAMFRHPRAFNVAYVKCNLSIERKRLGVFDQLTIGGLDANIPNVVIRGPFDEDDQNLSKTDLLRLPTRVPGLDIAIFFNSDELPGSTVCFLIGAAAGKPAFAATLVDNVPLLSKGEYPNIRARDLEPNELADDTLLSIVQDRDWQDFRAFFLEHHRGLENEWILIDTAIVKAANKEGALRIPTLEIDVQLPSTKNGQRYPEGKQDEAGTMPKPQEHWVRRITKNLSRS